MKISSTLVNEDLEFLRKRAKENITKYIDEYLPAEYENCLDGLNNILTEAWQMSLEGEKRERMQALALAKECYAMKLDLLSSATVIDRAVKFVDNHSNNNNNGLGRGLTQQNKEVVIDDTTKSEQNIG